MKTFNTRKLKVLKSVPKAKAMRPGTWKELLFSRMQKGNCIIAKLGKSHKNSVYAAIHQMKASGCFKMRTLDNGDTLLERVK